MAGVLEYKMQVRDNRDSKEWRDSEIHEFLDTDHVFDTVGNLNDRYGRLKYRAVPK